jgi:hypothetical protein
MTKLLELTFPDSDELPDCCRAVILLTPSGFNVAIQELDENHGRSVTNSWSVLADVFLAAHMPWVEFHRVRWFEVYPYFFTDGGQPLDLVSVRKPITLRPFERKIMRAMQAGFELVNVVPHGKWHRGEPRAELRNGSSMERMTNAALRKLYSAGLIEISGSKHVRTGIREQTFVLTAAGLAWLAISPRKPKEIDPIYIADMQLRNAPKAARKWLPLICDRTQRVVVSRGGHGYLIAPIGKLETKRYPYISAWVFSQIEPHLEVLHADDGLKSWRISELGRAWLVANTRKRKGS